MNILIQLSHPAQFHLFKLTAKELMSHGHNVHFVIKTKDILEQLLIEEHLPYYNLLTKPHRKNKLGIVFDSFIRDYRLLLYAIRHKIDLFVGTPIELTHVGWLLRKGRINFCEDDAAVISSYIKVGYPFFQTYMVPVSCDAGKAESKTIHYKGFHKLAYLHPSRFVPDQTIVERYFPVDKPYFILRFAQLNAYHDVSANAKGFTPDVAQKLIDILSPHGAIYITSERELEPQFEKYRLHINPKDIHHVLAYASLYIGDSQSMAVEAAMLGTPSIRFNDFVGRIGVLEELQYKYELTVGIPSNDPEQLFRQVGQWLMMSDLKQEFQSRRQRMLQDKIDVTGFFTWFIENYPQSRQVILNDPTIQDRFK